MAAPAPIITIAVSHVFQNDAVKLVLRFKTYLRPGECDRLVGRNLIRPQPLAGLHYQRWGLNLHPVEHGTAGKTQGFDESVVIDTDLWLGEILEQIKVQVADDQTLWTSSVAQNIERFHAIASHLGLGPLGPSRYALRHGGASEDLLSGLRSLDAIKKRGRWSTDASLRRYSKETKLLGEISKIPASSIALGKFAIENMQAILTQRIPPCIQ